MDWKPLPIGVEDFERIIEEEYYYVDKTELIKDILDKKAMVNLFTRPRRFGKTLNISMLRCFFEKAIDGKDYSHLFEGLKIASAGEHYMKQQGQYPVISMTLKSAKQPIFEAAYQCLIEDIAKEFARHKYVMEGEFVTDEYRDRYYALMNRKANGTEYARALAFLSECLYQYHGKKVIILLDEYDVPLENAYFCGFYDEMVAFICSLFESALKTNYALNFAVITGCLRISKESIFTGLNNLRIISILDDEYGEYFGFTESEVEKMLACYDRSLQMETMKKWYDGYVFGNVEVYNPWSVIQYVNAVKVNPKAFPVSYWANTSSNSVIRDLIYKADAVTKKEIQNLMDGESIEKIIHEDITYDEIDKSQDNLWNFLFFTGYLKKVSVRSDENGDLHMTLIIPNREVLAIYRNHIRNWFREDVINKRDLTPMYTALATGDAGQLEKYMEDLLLAAISYMDSGETFYHGFLLGILANIDDYGIKSNHESGYGRYDIVVYSEDIRKPPIIIELKVAKKYREIAAAAERGLAQIKEKRYAQEFADDGYTYAICYGIGFYKKQVCVIVENVEIEDEE